MAGEIADFYAGVHITLFIIGLILVVSDKMTKEEVNIEDNETFKIIKRNGSIDAEIQDGVYDIKAEITIENGEIKYIDDGVWNQIK